MFDSLRRAASKILVFVMFAVLIASFAIWGIGDVVRNFSQGPVATVGKTEISEAEYQSTLQQRRQMFARQLGQPVSAEQSRAFGIDAGVLGELINNAALLNQARSMGLRLSAETVADAIRADPAFQGPDQAFSRPLFDERIRQAGFTEQRYLAERRDSEIRDQLTASLAQAVAVPDTLVTITHKYREETRTVAWFALDPTKAAQPAKPDDKALQSVYELNRRTFTVPERRNISVLVVSPSDFKDRAKVSDEEVRQSWEQNRAAWDIPERRRIQQIRFKSKQEAEGEAKAIEGGKSFLLAALEADPRAAIDQGLVARREISDAAFAKIAFELPLNKLSEPIRIRDGYMLIRVSEIDPARTRTFDDVKAEVRQSLEDSKGREITAKLHDEIEDRRGASTAPDKLKQIAADLKLKVITADDVDQNGKGPDGKPAIQNADAQRILAQAFEGDALTPREALQLSDGSEAWVEVSKVTPAVVKPFDAVKGEVEKLWRERELKAALAKQAEAIVGRIKAGEAPETAAASVGAKLATTKPFKRAEAADGLAPAASRLAFTLAKGGAGSAQSLDGTTRIVLVVTDIKPAEAPTKEQAEAIRRELAGEITKDAMQTYVAALREAQGVKVNEAVFKRATGADQAP